MRELLSGMLLKVSMSATLALIMAAGGWELMAQDIRLV